MIRRIITTASVATLFAAMTAAPASAQGTFDQRTEFTFNAPVELPGTTLPPGTYVFRFVDPGTVRKVMHVEARDASNKNYGMFLTISAERPRPAEEAELRFMETPAGQPRAVKTWWYPGNTIGREFIYPKEQARRLAQATNQPVLTTQAETVTEQQMESADLTYVSPSGQETAVSDQELAAAAATTPPVGTAGIEAATPVQEQAPAARQTTTRTSLPRTGTVFPMVGLVGLLSLLGGAALRFRR